MVLEFHQLDRRWEHLRVRSPERQKRLLASLAESGQQTPIVVVAVADQANRYLVIDGYKRIAALEHLGRDTVEALIWPMGEAEALVLSHSMRLSAHETALEEGWLLAELEERFGYGLDDLARRFDRSVSWVSRRLALVELVPETVQQQVREGKISAHVAMKFLSPVARINLAACRQMADAFVRLKANSRQAGQLYAAWRDALPSVRQRILEQPELFLKVQRQVDPPQPAPTPAAKLLHDLGTVVEITNRVSRQMARAVREMDRSQCEEARRKIDLALHQLSRLAQPIPQEKEQEKDNVEQRATDGDSGTRGSGSEQTRDCAGAQNHAPDGAQSSWIELLRRTSTTPSRESRTLPATDSGSLQQLQGESGPGP